MILAPPSPRPCSREPSGAVARSTRRRRARRSAPGSVVDQRRPEAASSHGRTSSDSACRRPPAGTGLTTAASTSWWRSCGVGGFVGSDLNSPSGGTIHADTVEPTMNSSARSVTRRGLRVVHVAELCHEQRTRRRLERGPRRRGTRAARPGLQTAGRVGRVGEARAPGRGSSSGSQPDVRVRHLPMRRLARPRRNWRFGA